MGRPEELDALPLDELVARARLGDAAAWSALVRRTQRLVWKAVHMTGADPELREDAFAATYLRLAEHIHDLREPLKLPGWLVTTATNEVRRLARAKRPQDVSIDGAWGADSHGSPGDHGLDRPIPATDPPHDDLLVRAEAGAAVRRAFRRLTDDCRQLLTLVVISDPPVPYAQVAELLERPQGSLGPTRRRCLDMLRKFLNEDDDGSAVKETS